MDAVEIPRRAHGLESPIELAAFVKNRPLGRVEIFGRVLAQDTPAKADGATSAIKNGEHDPVAESVVATLAALNNEPGSDQELQLVRRGAQALDQVIPPGRRETELELSSDLTAQAPRLEVIHGAAFFRMRAQLALEEAAGFLQRFIQRARGGPRRKSFATLTRHLESQPLGEQFHRLHELQVTVAHEKAYDRPVGAAAKAVIELLLGADGEGRRLLVVKGAAGLELAAGFLERDVGVNDFDDVRSGHQVVDEILRNSTRHLMEKSRSARPAPRAARPPGWFTKLVGKCPRDLFLTSKHGV